MGKGKKIIMEKFPVRHAISRANFFLNLARVCSESEREKFEAYLEAAIVFSRSSMLRLLKKYEKNKEFKSWFSDLKENESVMFFKKYRDFILKDNPPEIGQIISFGNISSAADMYFFVPGENPITTVENHLKELMAIINEAESCYS